MISIPEHAGLHSLLFNDRQRVTLFQDSQGRQYEPTLWFTCSDITWH